MEAAYRRGNLPANDLQLGANKKPRPNGRGERRKTGLLHEQHLARSLDRAVEPALVMGRQAGVFAGQDAAVVGDELAQQIDALEIEGVDGEIDLGLRTGRAFFQAAGAAATFAITAVRMSFTGHKGCRGLLNLAVHGAPAEERIVLLDLEFLRLKLFVAGGGVTRRRLAFFAGLGAL